MESTLEKWTKQRLNSYGEKEFDEVFKPVLDVISKKGQVKKVNNYTSEDSSSMCTFTGTFRWVLNSLTPVYHGKGTEDCDHVLYYLPESKQFILDSSIPIMDNVDIFSM